MRFRATRTGLDVEESVVAIHRPGEHAFKFELGNVLFDAIDISDNGFCAVFVVFHFGEFKQFFRIAKTRTDLVNAADNAFEDGAFLA